jgi:hypothetical protein
MILACLADFCLDLELTPLFKVRTLACVDHFWLRLQPPVWRSVGCSDVEVWLLGCVCACMASCLVPNCHSACFSLPLFSKGLDLMPVLSLPVWHCCCFRFEQHGDNFCSSSAADHCSGLFCCFAAGLQECWCKKGAPSPELFTTYKMQPALPSERSSGSGRGGSSGAAEGDADAEQVAALTAAADVIGQLLQNHHQVSVCARG